MDKQIVIIKPGSLKPKDKEKLTKAGNIVIEHEKGYEVIFHTIGEEVKYVFTNCATCGDRIYLTSERMNALRRNGFNFYCPQSHTNAFKKTLT